MKKKLTSIILLMAPLYIIHAGGCKKAEATGNSCKVSSVTEPGYSPANISYRADGKIDKITREDELRTFTYNGNTTTILITSDGIFSSRKILTYNADGMVVNMRNHYNESGTEWYNDVYEYNGRQITRRTSTDSYGPGAEVNTYIWVNENIANETITQAGTIVYEYYTDKEYQPGDYHYVNQMLNDSYQVIFNKNLLKNYKVNNNSPVNYSYSFDNAGKIISITREGRSPVTLTHQCN